MDLVFVEGLFIAVRQSNMLTLVSIAGGSSGTYS